MCGISGCYLQRTLNDNDIKIMRRIRDSLHHRGPDGAGEYIDSEQGIYMGHRRLSIIDLDKRSAQPMKSERQIISFNGEIYNYVELREQMVAEYKFKTKSDTEVLIHAWDKWGNSALLKLDGMYAFALHDKAGLNLITDFFGEKPLYILETMDGFYYASEPSPLIKAFKLKWAPSAQALSQFIHLGYVEPPETGYEGLKALPPATHLVISKKHEVRTHRYWKPKKPTIEKGSIKPVTDSDIDQVHDLLCKSLEKRLRSDVSVGLFLSGGVDSALVGALAKNDLNIDLNSYTVSFLDGVDESPYATEIAKYLGIRHQIIETDKDKSWRDAPKSLKSIYGLPNDNMTALAVQSMCAAANNHLTVALSGLGGDELFYGYNKYETLLRNAWIYNFPANFAPLINVLPISKARTVAALISGDAMRRFLRIKNGTAQEAIENMNIEALDNMLESSISGLAHQVRFFDLISTMPQSSIPAIDRGSMRESIEVRTPFLNRDLCDFVMTLDQRALIHKEKKHVLRRLLERYMPLDLLTPTKQGFVYPFARYFNQNNYQFSCDPDLIKSHPRLAMRQCLLAAMTSNTLIA